MPFKVGTLGPHTVLPITISCPIIFSWISMMVWNLFPSKVILVWGKARSYKVPNLGCKRAELPGWFDVSPKNSAGDMMHERACCGDEAASKQFHMAVASWIIWIISLEECSSLMQNLMLIHCPTLRHFQCDSHTVHMLPQWRLLHPLTSTVKLSLFMHAGSSPSSLSARLYRYHTNSSYIIKGWPFSGQTLYIWKTRNNQNWSQAVKRDAMKLV